VNKDASDPFVHVRGASENNLRNIDVDVPRDAMVAFTGVSGSGKSSLAFGTLYAEAQRRYFESVTPYARRQLQQVGAPHVQEITGLPPAVALQQRRGSPSSRSTVGTLTTLSRTGSRCPPLREAPGVPRIRTVRVHTDALHGLVRRMKNTVAGRPLSCDDALLPYGGRCSFSGAPAVEPS
jgi:hypothetical protein